MLKINVYREGKKIGETGYLKLLKKNREKKHLLITEKNALSKAISIGDDLEIRVYYAHVLALIKVKIEKISLIKGKYFEIQCDYTPHGLYTYKQIHTDIFYAWENHKPIDWRNRKSVSFKNAWIRCCCFLNGVKKEVILKEKYILNGNEIQHPIDFYCLFGEALMGERGYMGAEANAFRDCLGQLRLLEKGNETKVYINNYKKVEDVFLATKGYEKELDCLLRDLSENGCMVLKEA